MSDDVKKTAEDWAAEFKQWLDAGNAYGSLSEAAMIGLRDQFARAILQERDRATMAERKRCMKIVEEEFAPFMRKRGFALFADAFRRRSTKP